MKVIISIITVVLATILNGFVFAKLWAWFIVSTFNADPLRIIEAIGLSFFIGFALYKVDDEDKTLEKEDFWLTFAIAVVKVVVIAVSFLGIGWIIQLFM